MSRTHARDLGDFPTPPEFARRLARETLGSAVRRGDVPSVLDPACGEGALLIAAGDLLRRAGSDTDGASLVGVEVHPGRAARARLRLADEGLGAATVVHADALRRPQPLRDGAFDVVIGNPPFLSPTATRGAIPAALRNELKSRHPGLIGALTNLAAIFAAEALQLVRPGGSVGMILPASFLASRDASGVRAELLRAGTLEWVWTGGTGVFDATVTVCGIVIRRGGRRRPRVRRADGAYAQRLPSAPFDAGAHRDGRTWSFGGSADMQATAPRIGDTCTPVAGFRRHFYAVADALRDDPAPPGRPVITAGLIDPGRVLWGSTTARIAKRDWRHPRADEREMRHAGGVSAWLDATAVPKVLVATQTRVIECAVDETGEMIPGVPVIALPARGRTAWRLAAALTSPYLSHLAFTRHAGAAMSPDAIKMSGGDLARLPLPMPSAAWDAGARVMREVARARDGDEWRDALARLADAMGTAYGLAPRDDPREWWLDRLPPFRGNGANR